MDLFFNALKGQFNTLNFILLLVLSAFILYKKNKVRLSKMIAATACLVFILASTAYFPGYIIARMESKFPPFDITAYPYKNEQVFIHVLGGGYTLDSRLPSPAQLSNVSLGRLAEGVRVSRLLKGSILIVSGNIASGDSSMARVSRNAAIALGFDSSKIEMVEYPASTLEEAKAFADLHGKATRVVVVTDAIHMPRAMRFFRQYGIQAYAAPTNFLIKRDDNPFALRWIPSVENFLLMDKILREFFGSIKGSMTK